MSSAGLNNPDLVKNGNIRSSQIFTFLSILNVNILSSHPPQVRLHYYAISVDIFYLLLYFQTERAITI